ncbi:MAG: RIP metalloprotease RseP [Woeseiaceae bacterium]|nr:RIP metalloprotease RseP [Woeseiaceae bacterium]
MTTIDPLIFNLLSFLAVIGILVTVHEYGHYIVGKLFGVKVLCFSVGFGRPIYKYKSKKGDKTEYRLSTIPLGGYVQFLDSRNDEVQPQEIKRSFDHQPLFSKISILFAGPLFNFIFAVLAYFFLFSNGVMTMKPIVGEVIDGSHASNAGLFYEDEIISINGNITSDWDTVITSIMSSVVNKQDFSLKVKNKNTGQRLINFSINDDKTDLTEPGKLFSGLGFYPWQPPPIVGEILENSPADLNGLKTGDTIISIDSNEINAFAEIRDIVAKRPDEEVQIEFLRNELVLKRTITLGSKKDGKNVNGFLGVGFSNNIDDYWFLDKSNFDEAFRKSIYQTWSTTTFTISMLTKMISGEVSTKNISGPFSIAKYAGVSASAGLNQFLKFLALISISLGVINLFPIPMLDGGQIVQFTIETLKGSPLSPRFELITKQFGIMSILILMSIAFYNDIFG